MTGHPDSGLAFPRRCSKSGSVRSALPGDKGKATVQTRADGTTRAQNEPCVGPRPRLRGVSRYRSSTGRLWGPGVLARFGWVRDCR